MREQYLHVHAWRCLGNNRYCIGALRCARGRETEKGTGRETVIYVSIYRYILYICIYISIHICFIHSTFRFQFIDETEWAKYDVYAVALILVRPSRSLVRSLAHALSPFRCLLLCHSLSRARSLSLTLCPSVPLSLSLSL